MGDPHFMQRERLGRNLAFLCRVYENGWSKRPRGIEVDEETALLIENDGSAYVVGQGFAYFLHTPGAPEVCAARTPLTYLGVDVYRIDSSGAFNLSTWAGSAYQVSALAGVFSSTRRRRFGLLIAERA